MKEAQEIANYIAQRIDHWKEELKKITDQSEKHWINGQIFEASKILKHIQDEYGINPNNQ